MKSTWVLYAVCCFYIGVTALLPEWWLRLALTALALTGLGVLIYLAYDEGTMDGYREGRHAEVESMCEARELAERVGREAH